MRKYIFIFFAVITCLFLPAFAISEDSIRLGSILMLTGEQSVYGEALREGIEIAVEEINQNGGIKNRKINMIIEDSGLKPKVAHTAATKLVKIDEVSAVLNASFFETMANGKVFEQAKIPVISLWDSAKEIEDIGDYVFGIGLWTPSSAKRASDYAHENLKAKTAVVINLQSEWSETVSDLFEKEFASKGGEVLNRFTLDTTTTDFKTVISKIKSLNPDVLYSPLPDNVVPFYKQLKQAKFNKPVISSDIIADEHIKAAPDAFEGIYQTNAQDPASKEAKKVMELYKKKYNKEPGLPLFVAWGYDGVKLIAKALETVGDDSQKIKDYLYTIENYPGASSTITINSQGSSPVMEKMFCVTNGKLELLDVG